MLDKAGEEIKKRAAFLKKLPYTTSRLSFQKEPLAKCRRDEPLIRPRYVFACLCRTDTQVYPYNPAPKKGGGLFFEEFLTTPYNSLRKIIFSGHGP
ncbi:MAG: hypothetical protein D3922_09565 [Candidatus Electrothrix sp. AR1]|nr:hypothetical protein [Candidatus Electrothrix sp. AR1]